MIKYVVKKGQMFMDIIKKKQSDLLEKYKNFKLNKILTEANSNITNLSDLTANEEPAMVFYLLADKLIYLLDNNPEIAISKTGIKLRKQINHLIKIIGSFTLSNKQIIENRNELMNNDTTQDSKIIIPNEPVIWAANHAFKDDTLATILSIKRNAYILFGSLPQFYNTFDGITAWLNGVIMTNRKVSKSKHASVDKAVYAIKNGADLMIFPEGVWNKSPNHLMLKIWPGIYRICVETGAKVIPVAHYIRDCTCKEQNNPIHTVIDNPIRIDNMSETAALNYLRDIICTWYYLMMEKYGKSTREQEVGTYMTSKAAWEQKLIDRVATVDRYDTEIEFTADYRPRDNRIDEIWGPVANIKNITNDNILFIEDAKQKIKQYNENDFQRRY